MKRDSHHAVFVLMMLAAILAGSACSLSAGLIEAVLDDYTKARNSESVEGGGSHRNVESPKRAGTHAFEHVCNGCKRAEIAFLHTVVGEEYWYGWSQYYPNKPKFGCVMQLHRHPPNKSCMNQLPCRYAGHLFFVDNGLSFIFQHAKAGGGCSVVCERKRLVNTIPRNVWIDYVMHAKWSGAGNDGFLRIWVQIDGKGYKKVLDHTGINWWEASVEDTGPYLKLGSYGGGTGFYSDEYRLGDASSSFDEVAPGIATSTTGGGEGTIDFSASHIKLNFGNNPAEGWNDGNQFVTGGMNHTYILPPVVDGVALAAPINVYRSVTHRDISTDPLSILLPELKNGEYTLRFHVADSYGERAIDISVEGRTVLEDLDPVTAAGGVMKPFIKDVSATISDGNGMEIVLDDNRAAPRDVFLAGLEIMSGPTAAAPGRSHTSIVRYGPGGTTLRRFDPFGRRITGPDRSMGIAIEHGSGVVLRRRLMD